MSFIAFENDKYKHGQNFASSINYMIKIFHYINLGLNGLIKNWYKVYRVLVVLLLYDSFIGNWKMLNIVCTSFVKIYFWLSFYCKKIYLLMDVTWNGIRR